MVSYTLNVYVVLQDSEYEKELRGIDGFSNDEILAAECCGFSDHKGSAYPYAGQLTWPVSESTIDRNDLR